MKHRSIWVGILAILTVLVGGFSSQVEAKFSDIPANHWAEAPVDSLVDMGITGGYPDGTFRGKKTVTRYELALYLVNYDRYAKKQYVDRLRQQDSKIQSLEVQLKQLSEMVASLNARSTNTPK